MYAAQSIGRTKLFLTATLALLAALTVTTLQAAPIHAAASANTVASVCTVHEIAFHHHKPTFSCLKERASAGISPKTVHEDRCPNSGYDLEIDTTTGGAYCFWTDTTCFLGCSYDYLGLGSSPYGDLYNVSAIYSLAWYCDLEGNCSYGSGWVMSYEYPSSTGNKFYYANGHAYDSGNSSFDGDEKVTQVAINWH